MADTSARAWQRSRLTRHRRRAATGLATAAWAAASAGAAWGQSHPAGVPQRVSRPGAAYTLYLDFAGFNFTGGWGGANNGKPGVIPAYDGAVNGLSPTDQAYVNQIWSGVAEKYAAFNVNVTTVDPALTAGQASTDAARQAYYDQTARTMHTIVGDTAFTAAGVSYVGVLPYTYGTTDNGGAGDGFHTNFVTPTGTGGEFGVDGIVGAAAHENGHAFGLSHQSDYNASGGLVNDYSDNNHATGNGSVSPVMGVTYYSQRGVWRQGKSDQNAAVQNDVAVIANDSGDALVDDGVGHAIATAALLPTTGTTVNVAAARGVILPTTAANPNPIGVANYTADVFAFNSAGSPLSLTVHNGSSKVLPGTADASPTLASSMSILNAAGTVLYTAAEDFSTQTETIARTLPAGTYYLQVTSAGGQVGQTDATASYFDMGSYFVTGTGVTGRSVGTFYWTGGASAARWSQVDGTVSNWRSEHAAGTDRAAAPAAADNVFLSVDSGATNLTTMTLGGSRTVNSLTFTGSGTTAATTGVAIGADGSTLTLAPYNGHIDATAAGVAGGVGLVVQAGAAADSIAAPIALPIGQTWQINNAVANPLTVSGVVSGTPGAGLTVTGGGRLVLTGANTYAGGTYVSASTVTFAGGSLGTGPVTLTNAGVAQFASGNTADLTTNGRAVAVIAGGGSVDTNGNDVTLANGVADAHAGPLTKLGAGTLTVGGGSNPTNLFVRAGTLALASGAAYSTAVSTTDANNDYSSVGQSAGDVAGLTVNGGATLTVAGDLNAGDNGGSSGTITVSPSGTVNVRTLFVAKFGSAGGAVVQTGGTVQEANNGAGPGDWRIGGGVSTADAAAVGTYTLSGGSLDDGGANLQVGAYGTGTLRVTGGTATVGGFLSVGRYAGSVGTVDLSGGTLTATANKLLVGEQGTGTLRVSGSAVVNANVLAVAQADGTAATGTVLQTGGTVNAIGGVVFGGQASGTAAVSATYVLGSGAAGSGTLVTSSVSQGTGSTKTTGTFRFAGGTLVPTASTTTFLQGLSLAQVTTGGAAFDTAGQAVTVGQPLVHDASLGGADGGLTKAGAGTLRLTAAETYTGATTVGNGLLVVNGSLAAGSGVTVAAAAALAGTGRVAGTVDLYGTITAGSGPTAADTIESLDTGTEAWLGGSIYAVKLDASKSTAAAAGTGRSGTVGVAADVLVLSGLSPASVGLTINPVFLSAAALPAGQYSFVIADATGSAAAFTKLLQASALMVGNTPANTTSMLSVASDGAGGQDLLLDVNVAVAAPEPTGLVLVGLAAAPAVFGRRRRRPAAQP